MCELSTVTGECLLWFIESTINSVEDSTARQLALEAKNGDFLACYSLNDRLEELEVNHNPYKVGDKVIFCSVTLYYIGEVSEVGFGWIRLKDASWIHWTGRLSSLLSTYDLTKVHGSRKSRTEYIGEVVVYLQSLVSSYPWNGKLLRESIS